MANDIQRPAGSYSYTDPFEQKPELPATPILTGSDGKSLGPADAAAVITSYLANVAAASVRTTYTTADTLDRASERGAITAGNILVDVLGTNPKVDAPVVYLPPIPDASTLTVDFDAALQQVKGVVDGLQDSWLMKYFPAAMPDGFDPLLQSILSGTIVSPAMQEIFWERAKDQATRDAARYEDEAVSSWASRGFSMPGGVINKQISRKNQDLFFANADLAAQQAIKALDIQVDSVKFAAEIGTRLRLGLIQGITGLVTAYSRLPSAAAEYAASVAEARRAAYAAVAEYFKATIEGAGLSLRASEANANLHAQYATTAAEFMGRYMSSQVQAAASATDSYAKIAADTISSLNNVTSIGIQST